MTSPFFFFYALLTVTTGLNIEIVQNNSMEKTKTITTVKMKNVNRGKRGIACLIWLILTLIPTHSNCRFLGTFQEFSLHRHFPSAISNSNFNSLFLRWEAKRVPADGWVSVRFRRSAPGRPGQKLAELPRFQILSSAGFFLVFFSSVKW